MRRKVIKQGRNTLTVTLPSNWSKRFGIHPGDEVDLFEKGREVVISPSQKSEVRSISIDTTGMHTKMIWRTISSAYRAGYDEIRVGFETSDSKNLYAAFTYNTLPVPHSNQHLSPLEAIQSLVNRFIGVEIIEQKHNHCIIKELGGIAPEEFDNALRRIFHLLQLMSEKLREAIIGKKDELKEIHMIDTNLDRFEDFCLRVLNRYGYKDYRKTQTMYTTVFLLEMLGDEYKRLSLHCLAREKPTKHFEMLLKHFDSIFALYTDLFYQFSKQKAEKIYKIFEESPKFVEKNFSKMGKEDLELLHHIKEMGYLIYSLTELRIDLEYI